MLTLSSPLKEKKRGRHGEGGCRRCEHLAQRPLVARAWAAQGPKGDPHRLTRDWGTGRDEYMRSDGAGRGQMVLNVRLRSLRPTWRQAAERFLSVTWCKSNTLSLWLSGERTGGDKDGGAEVGWEASAAACAEANGVAGLKGGNRIWREDTFQGCKWQNLDMDRVRVKGRSLGWLLGTFYISDKLHGRSPGGTSPQTLDVPSKNQQKDKACSVFKQINDQKNERALSLLIHIHKSSPSLWTRKKPETERMNGWVFPDDILRESNATDRWCSSKDLHHFAP